MIQMRMVLTDFDDVLRVVADSGHSDVLRSGNSGLMNNTLINGCNLGKSLQLVGIKFPSICHP